MGKLYKILATALAVALLLQVPVWAVTANEQDSNIACGEHDHDNFVKTGFTEAELERVSIPVDYCWCGGTIYNTNQVLKEETSQNIVTCRYQFCSGDPFASRLAEYTIYKLYSYSFCASCLRIYYKTFIGYQYDYICLDSGVHYS